MVTVPPRAAASDTLINTGVTVTIRSEPCWAGAQDARTPDNSKEATKKRRIAKASVPAV
ncbi:hypothetical protein GCM10008937_31140 [Deinococcus depolymerans]|uniref:Transposase n=1 Tax=Deinococcus depolymerans TaxID=392408 RepID=A0ABP3MMG8_9DEIO